MTQGDWHRRQAFLLRLSDALRPLRDPVDIQDVVTRETMSFFGADRCYYCEIEDGLAVIRRDAAAEGMPSLAGTYPLSEFVVFDAVVRKGEPLVVSDVRTSDLVDPALRDVCLPLQVISFIDIPIIKGGKPVGLLCVVQGQPREWTALEVELAAETAERTWAAVDRANAQERLRTSEEKYRTLFNSINDGFCIIEVLLDAQGQPSDFRYVEMNPAFEAQTGLRGSQGRTIRELAPDLDEFWFRTYGQVALTGHPERFERWESALGRHFDVYAFRIGEAHEHRVAVLFRDVTAERQHEARQKLLLTLSADLGRLSDEEEIVRTVGGNLASHLGLTGYHLVDVDEDRAEVTLRHLWHALDVPDILGTYPIAGFIAPESLPRLRAGKTVVVNDVNADLPDDSPTAAALRAGAAAQQIAAYIAVPYSQDGRWQAYFAVADSEARVWPPGEIELVQEVASRMFPRIARVRTGAALLANEAKYRALFDSLDEGVTLFERLPTGPDGLRDYRYLAMNPAMQAMFGVGDLSGQSIRSNFPDEAESWYDDYDRVLDTGQPVRFERESVPQGMVLDMFVARVEDGSGRLLAVMRDITERRQAQAARRRGQEHQAFLLMLSDRLRTEVDADAVARTALELLADHLHLDRAYVARVDRDRDLAEIGPEYRREDLVSVEGVLTLSRFPEAFSRVETGTLVLPDTATDPTLSDLDRQGFAALHMGAVIVASARRGTHNPVWALLVAMQYPRRWTPDEIALIEDVAERTWAAVERTRAETALSESEALLRSLIQNLPGGAVFVVDHDLRYLLAQGEALLDVGLTPETFVGRTVAQVTQPEPAPGPEAQYRQALAGQSFEVEHTAHGRTFLTRGVPLRNAAGVVTAALAVSFDLTDRKRAEDEIRLSQARLKAAFDVLPMGVGVVDMAGRLLMSNSELLLYLPTGLMPSLDPERRERWVGFDAGGNRVEPRDFPGARALRGERVVPGIDMLYTTDDGTQIWTYVSAVPLRGPAGEITGQVHVVANIDALKRTEEALRTLNATLEDRVEERTRRLADLNAELGTLITRTAHNLEAPAEFLGQLLDQGLAPNTLPAGLLSLDPAALADEAARLRGVSHDLRELSKLERHDLNLELIPLKELLRDVQAANTGRAEWLVGPLPIVRADRALLRQALDVLMTFTLSDTRGTQYVTVQSSDVEGELHLTFEDDGTGLAPEEASTLFDLAVRSGQSVPILEGSGLAQVRRILARHGGWAWAESRLSGGRVVLAFPRDLEVRELERLLTGETPHP